MCGIIGYWGWRDSREVILHGLREMEYRGYDSAGLFDGRSLFRAVGPLENLIRKIPNGKGMGIGIGHTRWATHGGVEERNAHPHPDCNFRIFAAHNGIIDNYREMQESLRGHEFRSETDSEVIPHFFEDGITREKIEEFYEKVKGEFAIVLTDGKVLVAMRNGSPLVIGIGENEFFVSSDIYAFLKYTRKAIFLEDGEYAIIDGGLKIFKGKEEVRKDAVFLPKIEFSAELDAEHYMIKEIREEEKALKRMMLNAPRTTEFRRFVEDLKGADEIWFVGAGTSYHAGLFLSKLLNKFGRKSHAVLASEADEIMDGMIVAISQSGETMDLIKALKGKEFIGMVNVPYSTIQRMSKYSVNIFAGKEVAVAATKSFINQIGLGVLTISEAFGLNIDILSPVRKALEMEDKAEEMAKDLAGSPVLYLIGSSLNYPIALEIGLKIKEIAYIPTITMASGELKHGTLALIEDGTNVLGIIESERDVSAKHEIEARGGVVHEIPSPFKGIQNSLFSATFGHLVSYHIAKMLGREIDKPRNLAKSVTVK